MANKFRLLRTSFPFFFQRFSAFQSPRRESQLGMENDASSWPHFTISAVNKSVERGEVTECSMCTERGFFLVRLRLSFRLCDTLADVE